MLKNKAALAVFIYELSHPASTHSALHTIGSISPRSFNWESSWNLRPVGPRIIFACCIPDLRRATYSMERAEPWILKASGVRASISRR